MCGSSASKQNLVTILREVIIVKRVLIFGFVTLFSAVMSTLGQSEQVLRHRERIQGAIQAAEDRQKAEKEAAANEANAKPAVMNVDVQMVLAKAEYKAFAAAKPFAIERVADGDPLWIYVKFNGNLERYIRTLRDENDNERYVLFAEIGPQGDVTARSHYVLEFSKDDLKLTELKISLTAGMPGHNRSLPLFLKIAGSSKPGFWKNELRLTNSDAIPRGLSDNLATA